MIRKDLQQILELESAYEYDDAFLRYKIILEAEPSNFEIWKYYFFFLWSMLEDLNDDFTILSYENLKAELSKELEFGINHFNEIAEFNFIAGYTISIFPYEFGDYIELETLGKKLLKKATNLDRENLLYKMVLLGSEENLSTGENKLYQSLKLKVKNNISEKEICKGLLDSYYQSVFCR